MARRRTALARRARASTRRVASAGANLARRGASATAKAAAEERHTLVALGAAGAAGYMRREGMLDNLPHIDAIGVEGTYGLAAWALGRWMRSRVSSHVATGLLAIAVNRLAAGEST